MERSAKPKASFLTHRLGKFVVALGLFVPAATALAAASGAVYTTVKDGTAVNQNIYGSRQDVYISGGPQNLNAAGLPNGTYYFQVTDPSGRTLLSSDNAVCRQLDVTGGRVSGSTGPGCKHSNGTLNSANGARPVQLAPFSQTPNAGNEYKVWLIAADKATVSATNPKVLTFSNSNAKTDNFKARSAAVAQGSCQPSSSLSALVLGTNVTSYIPKGSWGSLTTGLSVVNVEGTSITNSIIVTPNPVNSCASNPLTGVTVCTANNTDVYLLSGTTLAPALTSGGSGVISFSGGSCTNCGVAMDADHNRAVLGLSIDNKPGFQVLQLGTSTFEAPFASSSLEISEDPLIDPIRNLLLSAAENNVYEIIDLTTSTTPAFFQNSVPSTGEMDSSGEDCSTGIVLAPYEFSTPSNVFIADISNPAFAPFTAGAPGSWTAPSQVQTLIGSVLSAGASGIAVAQGTHVGVISGEFGGDEITAIELPAVSGAGAVPAISRWITCKIGSGFNLGLDPHTVTAYQSPNGGAAIGLLADIGATTLARVDLSAMLALSESSLNSHVCESGTLPASVVSFISVP